MKKVLLLILILIHTQPIFSVEKKVKVETPVDYVETEDGQRKLTRRSYLDLRPNWGTRLTVSTAEHSPVPELLDLDGTPLQVELSLVKNLRLMSLGFEGGYLTEKWSNTNNDSLDFNVFYIGAIVHIDGIFETPYVVPYLGVGVTDMDVEISYQDGSPSEQIETEEFTPYYKAGLMFSLNWLDKRSAMRAYDEFGLLNTYLYIGLRKWMETNADPELNVEIELSPEFGLQLEF